MHANDLKAYRERYAAVARREALRTVSVEEKLSQLAALMASVDAMGWRDALSDDEPVWARWQKLRRAAGTCGEEFAAILEEGDLVAEFDRIVAGVARR